MTASHSQIVVMTKFDYKSKVKVKSLTGEYSNEEDTRGWHKEEKEGRAFLYYTKLDYVWTIRLDTRYFYAKLISKQEINKYATSITFTQIRFERQSFVSL